MIHLDSSFLIDLQREVAAERPGPAFDLIESLEPDDILAVSVHVVCELRAGAVRPGPIYARMWVDQDLKKKMGK